MIQVEQKSCALSQILEQVKCLSFVQLQWLSSMPLLPEISRMRFYQILGNYSADIWKQIVLILLVLSDDCKGTALHSEIMLYTGTLKCGKRVQRSL